MSKLIFISLRLQKFLTILLFLVAIFLSSCNKVQKDSVPIASPIPTSSPVPTVPISFTESNKNIPNPERGWFKQYTSDAIDNLETFQKDGVTLIQVNVDIKQFKAELISAFKLKEIKNVFAIARKNGVKVIFRAAYGYTDKDYYSEPKNINMIINHIKQLKPIFKENEDVIHSVQAGFLGPWGEWHGSNFGAIPSLESRKSVLFSLLDVVPKSRTVSIRRPDFFKDIFSDTNILSDTRAYNGSNLSRVGFHNDAFLSTSDDQGTYSNRASDLKWASNQSKYTTFGGETNTNSDFSNPENAIKEMELLHAEYLNIMFLPEVIQKWKNTSFKEEGTFFYISKRLGYRLVIESGRISSQVTAGETLLLNLEIKNMGFTAPHNPRVVEVILDGNGNKYVASVNEDPRRWYRENATMKFSWYFSIPVNIASGKYKLYLNLPDPMSSIKNDPRYSIQFANEGVWNASTGYNLIKADMDITGGATPQTDGNEFKQIY